MTRHVLIVDKNACRLYELFDAQRERRQLEGRLGRRLEPALEPPASRTAGRRRTPRACRSCPASCATTRSPPAPSATRCASRPSARHARTSTPPATTPAAPANPCRRWGCACGSRPRSTSRATASRRASCQALKTYGMILADNGSNWYISGASTTSTATTTSARLEGPQGLGLRGRRHLEPAQRMICSATAPPDRGTPGAPGESTMRTWATSRSRRPPCSSQSSFCLTYFLCVGPRRAIALTLAGVVPLIAIAIWLDTGGSDGACGPSCIGPQGRRAGRLVLALSWIARQSPRAPPSAPGATTSSGRSRSLEQPPRSPAPEPPREPPGAAQQEQERAGDDDREERAAPDHGDHARGRRRPCARTRPAEPAARSRCRAR